MKKSQLNLISATFVFLTKTEESYVVEWTPTQKRDNPPNAPRMDRAFLYRVKVYNSNGAELASWWADIAANRSNAADFIIKAEAEQAILNEG